jgi:hypothetical protein
MSDMPTPDMPSIPPEIMMQEMQMDITNLMTQNAALRGLIRMLESEIAKLQDDTPEDS